MVILQSLFYGFSVCLEPLNLFACFIGALLGTLVGVLPGLGPVAAISLLLPVTFKMPTTASLIMLGGIYYGAMYGGSTTSILMNIPGESASVVTCLDGYQMARNGRAGAALGISAFGSFIAGTFGVLGITLIAPLMVSIALKFGPPEYVGLIVMGLSMVVYLTSQSLLKALIIAVIGLLLGTIGVDPMVGSPRFHYGITTLLNGLEIPPVVMGLFGVSEVLENIEKKLRQESLSNQDQGTPPHPGGLEALRAADCSRFDHRFFPRNPSRGWGDHPHLYQLLDGKKILQIPGEVWDRRHRGGGRS